MSDPKVLYFGYASNLLEKRLRANNNTGFVFKTIGKLENYKLEFDYKSERWHGASATITKAPGDHVWGVVYVMDSSNIPNLDRQEDMSIYEPLELEVTSEEGERLVCRTYSLLDSQRIYEDKRPSPQYLDVITCGAIEHKLPAYYIDKLKAVKHNGYSGPCPLYDACINDD